MAALFILDVVFLMALISRWHGGGWDSSAPHGIKAGVWAVPFALQSLIAHDFITAGFALAASWAGKATGHGRGQSLKEPLTGDPERIELLTSWAINLLPTYWYKIFILFAAGIMAVSGGVIGFIFTGDYFGALAILLGGAAKPLAYAIGWKIFPHEFGTSTNAELSDVDSATEIGEFLTGAFAGLGIAGALWTL